MAVQEQHDFADLLCLLPRVRDPLPRLGSEQELPNYGVRLRLLRRNSDGAFLGWRINMIYCVNQMPEKPCTLPCASMKKETL